MAVVREFSFWPEVADVEVRMDAQQIDVTTFGDVSPKYISGPMRYVMTIELFSRSAVDRVLAALSAPTPRTAGEEVQAAVGELAPPLATRRVRFIDLTEDR